MIKRIVSTITGLAMIAAMGTSIASNAGLALASPTQRGNFTSYTADLTPLNNSGVTGSAQLTFQGKALSVNLVASGLVPSKPHPVHIHGKLTGADAVCPTNTADTNNDGFVSVFEGAPFYGPIKLNLTTPQTPFGAPANNVLFAPFAGTPNLANFPVGSASGQISINQTYTFDLSKQADREAYAQLKVLNNQHIVVHGGYAPQNVDTAGGSSDVVYDALLPVACGQIQLSYGKNNMGHMNITMSQAHPTLAKMHHDDENDQE